MRYGRGASAAGAVAVAAALVVGAAGCGGPGAPGGGTATGSQAGATRQLGAAGPRGTGGASAATPGDAGAKAIAAAQLRLRSVPGDWQTWANLGAAYVQQARLTADPTYYPKADGALARSLRIRPRGNDLALTGQGALAAARHDFSGALRLGDAAIVINPFSSTAYGVRADALVELGRYPQAWEAVQRMVDLRPGVPSFTRASYTFELRGDIPAARAALQRSAADATSPADAAYALYYLGELAWNAGDVDGADARYREGLARDPSSVPLLAGRAKVAAARGRTGQALADYRTVVDRLPQPSYVIEYGELLAASGRRAEADQQYDLVRAEEKLFRSQGVDTDLELALFEADHGDPATALTAASAEFGKRRGVFVEDAYAWTLHRAGRDRDALGHARSALRLGTRSAMLHYHLGVIEAGVGNRDAAARELRTALRINPRFSPLHAPRAQALLTSLAAS